MAGPMNTYVLDAVRTLLGTYLTAEFAAGDDDVVVLTEWPNPAAALPPKCVCITVAEGTEALVKFWPPAEFRLIPDAGDAPISGRVQYTYGKFTLPMQLDAWAQYPAQRSVLAGRLLKLLFRHPNETLHNDTWPRLGAWHELVLRDESLPGFLVYYRFNAVPVPVDGGRTSQEGEYRLLFTGTAEGFFTSEEAVALMRTLTIQLDAGPEPLGTNPTESVVVPAP